MVHYIHFSKIDFLGKHDIIGCASCLTTPERQGDKKISSVASPTAALREMAILHREAANFLHKSEQRTLFFPCQFWEGRQQVINALVLPFFVTIESPPRPLFCRVHHRDSVVDNTTTILLDHDGAS